MSDPQRDKQILSVPGERVLPRPRSDWPKDFRAFMGWMFLAEALPYLTISAKNAKYARSEFHEFRFLQALLFAPTFTIIAAVVSLIAWWTVWKRVSSARIWALVASTIYVLTFARQFVIPLAPVWDHGLEFLLVGIVGFVAFWRPTK